MLTDRQIKSLKSIGKDKLLSDGGGLYIRVSVTGSKTFLYRTKKGGKTRYTTLGTYPALGLLDARKKTAELQGKAIGIATVKYAVDAYIDALDYLQPEQVRQRLEKDLIPDLGTKRLSAVTTSDLTKALQTIVDRGSLVAANRTLADIKHLFTFAYEKGWVHSNPAERITRKVAGGKEESREVILTDDEIKHLIKVLRTDRFQDKTRVGLALMLLTGQRSSEVLNIPHSKEWWTIQENKSDRPHKVYLVPLARWLSRHAEVCDHRTLSRALKRMKVRYTPHDLRRTVRTRMSDLGVLPHVAEKCLNHKLEGVLAVYDRGDYIPEREAAWKRWACQLDQIRRTL